MSEVNIDSSNISTFIAVPVEALQNNTLQKSDQIQIAKDAIIKTLSDGSFCIILDPNNLSFNNAQVEITQLPFPEASAPVSASTTVNVDESQAQVRDSQEYKCPKCNQSFEKMVAYRKHMLWHQSVKKFKCDKCSAGYNMETNLKIHMAMHADGKPTCPVCAISFQRLASLKSHLMLHQIEELYTCEECGAEFEKEEELKKHSQNHMNNILQENNLVCTYCNVKFDDKKIYKEHIAHHVKVKKMVLSGKKSRKTNGQKNNPHVCRVCLKSFCKLSLLERHLRVHSGERPFVCELCKKGFNQKGTLQIHLSKHSGIKPFQCTLCSAKFNQKGNLRVHVEKTHTAPMPGVKMFKCPHCTCIFKKVASLNVHITKCHASSEDVAYISNVMNNLKELENCISKPETKVGESFANEHNARVLSEMKKNSEVGNTSYVRLAESFLDGTIRRYLVMQKKINDVKWYICNYCNKEFKKPSDLIRHTRVHTKEKPFSCKQCGASFSLKSTLFYHVKTHMKDNNSSCPICAKKFSSLRALNVHLRKHTNKEQYKCILCNKWFKSIQKAKQHAEENHNPDNPNLSIELKQPLLHTPTGLKPLPPQKNEKEEEKPYLCRVCGSKFSKVPNLKKHMLLHNGERKHKCDQCLKSYFTAHALKEHMLTHSGIRNFGCKVCGKKFMTSSLLKRHSISHSTNKPYVCPYCNKSFKSVVLCKKHMNVHKKEAMLLASTESTNNVTIADNSTHQNLEFGVDNTAVETNAPSINLNLNNIQLIEHLSDTSALPHQISTGSGTQLNPQFIEISQAPQPVQVITNLSKNPDSNQVETIYINCEDLGLTDGLYTQNSELLLNSITELPEHTFSIDPVSFEAQNLGVFGSNLIDNEANEKVNASDTNLKQKSDISLTNNVSYCSQSELNLLFNLDTDLTNENLNLPEINLNEVPIIKLSVKEDKREEEEKEFTCTQCKKIFTVKKTYLKHLQTHNQIKKPGGGHQCTFCFKIFKKHSDLIRHLRTHTGERPYACDNCDKKFSLKSTLMTHQKTHDPLAQKLHNCTVCNSSFSSRSSLKVHMSMHTGGKSYKCSYCLNSFRTSSHRKSHEMTCHVKKPKNKVTNLLASIAMDVLQSEQSEQPPSNVNFDNVLVAQEQFPANSLSILNESAATALPDSLILPNLLLQDNLLSSSLIQLDDGTLLDVKTLNSSEKPEEATANTLIQTGNEKERNFECDICHKKYASKDVLRKHRKIHNKKFRCTKCDKGFDDEGALTIHEKTHEGLRPYACVYCNNSFAKDHSLATHMKRIHNVSLKDLLL